MAGKYWWEEDEQQSDKQTTTQSNTQTGKKYWWEEDAKQSSGNSYWWDDGTTATTIGSNITNQVNSWLQNHSTYISDYQKRFSGRKGSYEDAYVSDSADWLTSVSQRTDEYDAQRQEILSYMDQYKDYLDADWVEKIRNTLAKGRDAQLKIRDAAKKDNEFWSGFGNEELVKQYGSAEDAYKYFQMDESNRKTYAGMTSDEISEIIGSMDDGAQKDWLTNYKGTVKNDELLKLDTTATQTEIEALEQDLERYGELARYYDMYQANPEAWSGEEYANTVKTNLAAHEQMRQKYGSVGDLDKLIQSKRLDIANAKRIQKGAELAAVADSTSSNYDPEFLNYSKYVAGGETSLIPDYKDVVYDVVNDGTNPNIESKKALGQSWKRITGSEDQRLDSLKYMTDEERGIYNYYYNKHGYDAAEEYLDTIMYNLNSRQGTEMFKPMENKWLLEEVFGIAAGLDQFNSGLKSLFSTDDYITPSATQFASGMVRDDLEDTGFKLPKWMGGASLGQGIYDLTTTTANMAPSILMSTVVGSINPAAGAAVGSTLMGASAAGNAYQEALNLGYDKGQARAYSTLVGASEAGLQYLMGGIGKLGGKLTGKAVTSLASKFDGAFAKLAIKFGGNMLSEGAEEYLQEILTPVFKNMTLNTDEEISLITEEAIYSFLLGALTSGVMEGGGTAVNAAQMLPIWKSNRDAVKTYGTYGEGGAVPALIESGLESPTYSESYELAEAAKRKTDKGKKLSGYEIRQLVSANEAQISSENFAETKLTAQKKLKQLGETENVSKIADLVAKRATGQELTRSEISTLTHSQFGAQVAKEMRDAALAEKGMKSSNVTYKSLESRVDTETPAKVSDTGKAVIRDTGEEIDLTSPTFKQITEDGVVLDVNGKPVRSNEIDYDSEDQGLAINAIGKIEHITPAVASSLYAKLDMTKPVMKQLNGMDEAFTYGYYNYSEADLEAGTFTGDLTKDQLNDAYKLGQYVRKNDTDAKADAFKQMRTAADAVAEKNATEGKAAPGAKNLTLTYNKGNGEVVSIDEAKLNDQQSGGVEWAKVLHKMGLGTRVEFFESYESETMTVKDKKTGKVKKARVFINDAGVEQIAYSGVYRKRDGTIRIDLNAYNGRGFTLNALAHELTHFIQQWSDKKYKVLVDFLMKEYEKTDMTMHERVLREQKRLENIRGEEVSYDEAYDEVVANAMNKMFDDGKMAEKLAKLKEQDKNLAQKLWEGFKEILAKFIGIYEKEGLFQDADVLVEMKETFEQLQNMFAEALVEASDNYQASLTMSESQSITEAGIGFDEDTKSVYSLHFSTAYKDEIQVGKKTFDTEAIAKIVAKGTGRSIEDARKWVQSEMTIANIVMANPEFLDFEADSRYEAIKKNSDYPQGTVDLSNLCPKREEFTTMFDMLQKKYPNKLFTAQDVAEMRKILSDNDITVACGACFVEDRRQLLGEIADTYINMWKEAVETGKPLQKTNAAGVKSDLLVTKALAKQYGLTAGTKIMATDTYIPNQYDLTTYEGFKLLEKNHPTIAMGFNRYNNSRGQQSARLIEGRAEYKRQILGWSDAKVRSVNNNGGLRIFSFSDFEVVHLLDLVQVIIDCAAKGVKIQGYTKIPAFAKLVRDTGIKLNRSLIPKGDYGYHMENGKVVLDYDTTEGIDINDKNFIDESANPNVGNIVIGINPTQIGAAMLDPFVDYIIPFHSNKAKEILKKLGTGEWVNYKESQHEKDISTGTSSKHNVNIYTEVLGKYHPTNKVEFVEAFLKECKRQGKIPRYAEFLNVDANGDYAYREGYQKLLVDFKMFDADGNILPQGNITPKLNEGFMTELLNAEVDKKQNYEFPQKVYDAIDKQFGEQYSEHDVDTDEITDYDGGKKETKQEDKANVTRKETRESFHRRAHEKAFTVRERGQIALGYAPVTDKTERAGRTEENLKKLGIQVIVHEGLEVNVNGITRAIPGDATSVAGDVVYVRNSMETDPMETAGHEAYHFWKRTDARLTYEEIVTDNIDFASDAFVEFQKKISKAYHGEEIGIEDDGTDKLVEEIYAYITGLVHAGDSNNIVRPFLRDYDAVKAAWDDLIKKQATDSLYSSQETDADNAPTFYSKMGKVIEGMKQEKFGASSVISMLRDPKRGVKAEEIRWSGIQAFLEGKKSVTKQELLDFINSSMLQIVEESRTDNKVRDEYIQAWRNFVDQDLDDSEILDGLNNLDEMESYLESLVEDEDLDRYYADYILRLAHEVANSKDLPTKWDQYKLEGGANYRELVFKMPGSDYSNTAMQTHWGEDAQGVLAHARMQDFNTFIGKMLFIEEIQSDWHNQGQKDGYRKANEKTVEQLRKESEKAYEVFYNVVEKMVYDNADWESDNTVYYAHPVVVAEMFDGDESHFERLKFTDEQKETIRAMVAEEAARKAAWETAPAATAAPDAPFKKNYHEYVLKRLLRMAAEEGYDSIGWTTAETQDERWQNNLPHKEGTGKSGFLKGYQIEYDQNIKNFLSRFGKQWDSTVGKTVLDNGTEVWSMAITDSMKDSVLKEGQEMYSEHDTDYSNRSLLANAFEGITNGSEEYKLIQEYKGHIAELNSLENKLSEFNREIRKIRFGSDGQYDAEKLRRLETEAKKIAEAINRHDRKLVSLEASAPLRRLIERERKKEAQKTKDHVREIQQNKKVRAEQTELRHKIRKTIRDLDKILNRGNKKQNVKEDIQLVVTKALQAAEILFTDNYGNYDMLRNGIGATMEDHEKALVESCAKMLKDLDKMPTDGYDNFMARQEAENRLKTKMSKLKSVFARERSRLKETEVSSILGELADAYASLEDSEQSYVQGAYSEAVHNFLKNLQKEVGGTFVYDMTKDQLENVYAAYRMVLNTVRNANKMFNEELKQSREQLGNAVIEEVIKAGGVHLLGTETGSKISQFFWNNMKPIWVANRIGSDTFGKLMSGLFKGQYNFAVDIDEAKRFKLSMDKKYHPREWDAEKLYEFRSSTGKEFSLNLQQIMSLYAFSKREQAYDHLLSGGFAFEKNSTVIVEENGRKKTYIHKGATTYKLNEATLNGIINTLTAEQKAYADEMQKYLSETMGAKGNEVSMQLYGIKMFNEQFYFPLRSSGDFMEKAKAAELKKEQGQINLVNSGFTHSVKPHAKNPIILSGFMDVWAEHCNEMSMYHSMVLPMEDFRKVYNYTTVHDENFDSAAVRQTIIDAYGEEATKYIDQLYSELNAGATVDPRETPWKSLISKFKKSSVLLSASVWVQQFSSIGRAYAVIDPKYFTGTKVNSDTKLSAAEEMKKYAPVAIIKEMGGFDTGTKGSAKSYILAEKYGEGDGFFAMLKDDRHGKAERIKGLVKDEQYRGDIMGYLPTKADEKTWCTIWEASKRETKAKHPKMDVKSEEFLKLAGERFSEVIEKTQVYDSVLARSANMRSKGNFMAMATAFMAEPTTTINLIEDAIRSGNKKYLARTFGAVAVTILLNNALASIVYAMRDDDEDETFIEKYFQSFTSGMVDDINPMSYYPFLKDIYSLFQGYDVERTDMAVFADVRDALKKVFGLLGKDTSEMDDEKLAEHYKQVNEVFMSLLDAGFSAFGVPVKNVRRDGLAIVNGIKTIGTDLSGERVTTWNSFWDNVGAAVKDTVPIYAWTKDKAKTDKLYDAIIGGDTKYLERMKGTYKTEDAYQSAVRKALRENDSRIKEAAQARYEGNSDEYKRIFREIQNEGRFSFDDIMSAINTELSKLEPDNVTSDYTATGYVEAIVMGNMSGAEAMKEDIIATKVANGKTPADAEKEFVSSVANSIGKAYSSGLLDEAGAKNMLVEYAGKDEDEAASKVSYWAFCEDNPKYDYFNESNVKDYREFAEPENISLEVFAQFINGTKGLADIKDEWGDVEVSKREQVLEVIDSLDLTWQQKDALYLAARYAESKIWDVPW